MAEKTIRVFVNVECLEIVTQTGNTHGYSSDRGKTYVVYPDDPSFSSYAKVTTQIDTSYGVKLELLEYKRVFSSSYSDFLTLRYYSGTSYLKYAITGIPLKTGNVSASIQYKYTKLDSYSASNGSIKGTISTNTTTMTIPVSIEVSPVNITTLSLPNCKTGKTYTKQLEAIGNTPITWSIKSGFLPFGLSLEPTTGIISGIALQSQT